LAPRLGNYLRTLTNSRDFVLNSFPKNSVGVEIGVDRGDFSQRILKIVKPKKFHLIDPWKYEVLEIYKNSLYGGKAGKNQIVLDKKYQKVLTKFQKQIKNGVVSIYRDNSENALNSFENNYFDWAYIDGNHLYEFVKKDLELCYLKIKKEGIIALDDYGVEGWWRDGVTKAVDEFSNKGMVQIIKVKNNQCILKK
jgi:hypothetical protein